MTLRNGLIVFWLFILKTRLLSHVSESYAPLCLCMELGTSWVLKQHWWHWMDTKTYLQSAASDWWGFTSTLRQWQATVVKVETLSCHKAPKDMMSHTDTACEREGLCAGLPGLAVLQCPSQCVLGPEGRWIGCLHTDTVKGYPADRHHPQGW